MTKLSILAFTAVLAVAGASAPAFAATLTAGTGNVPLCSSGSGDDLNAQKQALSDELQLSTKQGSNIDVWNGCLKVMTTEAGKTNVAFYDPDTLKLVATI